VNDLEFCEDLETLEAQIEGGQTNLVITSPFFNLDLPITGSPFNGALSKLLIGFFGKNLVNVVDKPKFQLGFKFIVPTRTA
jgi:hypothetical protein